LSSIKAKVPIASTRQWPRYSHLKDVALCYEGRNEVLSVRPPDISLTGMFLNTMSTFPEGAILKVHFRLAQSNYPVDVRCEVRYCLPGVGVGLEFIDITAKDKKAILREIGQDAQKTQ
jgi:PilZ domain